MNPLLPNRPGQTFCHPQGGAPSSYADHYRTIMMHSSNRQFDGAGSVFHRVYSLSISHSGAVDALQLGDGSSANMITAMRFAVTKTNDLTVTLTTGQAWGTRGGSTVLYATTLGGGFIPCPSSASGPAA